MFSTIGLGNLQTLSHNVQVFESIVKPWEAIGYNDMHQSWVEITFKIVVCQVQYYSIVFNN